MERTTVTVASRDGEVELRATGQVILFDGSSRSTRRGATTSPPAAATTRTAGACRRWLRAIALTLAGDALKPDHAKLVEGGWQGHPVGQWRRSGPAAFHPAAPALHRGHAGQADGGAGHRAALHLRLDHRHDPGPRLCPEGQGPAVPRGQGTAGDGLPRQLLPPLSRIRLHRQSRGPSWTTCRPAKGITRTCSNASGRIFSAAVSETSELRITDVLEKINEVLEPHLFPPTEDGQRPAPLPQLRQGSAVDAHRTFGRSVHRLFQLSRMPLHPPFRPPGHGGRRRGGRAGTGRQDAGHRPRHEPGSLAEDRPFRTLCPARRCDRGGAENPPRLLPAQGLGGVRDGPREGADCS